MKQRDQILQVLKDNLVKAQSKMKFFADKHRTDRELAVGDKVYLKLRSYRQSSIAVKKNLKLCAKNYGPFWKG